MGDDDRAIAVTTGLTALAFVVIVGNGLALDILSPVIDSQAAAWLAGLADWPQWVIGSKVAAWLAGSATWPQWWTFPNFVTIVASLVAVLVTYRVMRRIVDRRHLSQRAAFGAAWFATICGGIVGGIVQWLVRTVFVVLGNIEDLLVPDLDEVLENPHYLIPYLGPLAESEDIYRETPYPDLLLSLGIGTTWGVLTGLIAVAPAALLATRHRNS